MVDVFLNGRRTPLQMRIHDDGRLVFPQWDNSSTPEPDAMSSLPLKEGKNSIDFRLEEKVDFLFVLTQTCIDAANYTSSVSCALTY